MDKYQKRLIRNIELLGLSSNENGKGIFYRDEEDLIELRQSDDIMATKYPATIKAIDLVIEQVCVIKGKTVETLDFSFEDIEKKLVKYRVYNIVFDFENRIDAIELKFHDDFADPLRLNIKYVEANKDAYFEKQAIQLREQLLKNMSVSHRVGLDLVNIYWRHATSAIEKVRIDLYVKEIKERRLIGSYSCDKENMFKAITGLAFGDYEYQLNQMDKDNQLIIQTDFLPFRLSRNVNEDQHFVARGRGN